MSEPLDDKAFKGLQELLKNAESCVRLTQFERDFLDSMRSKVLIYKERAFVSDGQWTILQRIEAKVYAT